MARFKLSESRIKGITRAGIYSDGAGLFLRVRKGGSKQFLFVVKRGGRRTELGLGGYGNPNSTAPVSLALAREKAEALRQRLARGEDIREGIVLKRQQARGAVTFWECAQQLIEAKRPQWSNGKHARQWEMTLREYAEPLHDLPVADITVADVKACLLPHWQERPETAARLRARVEAVIAYGMAHQWRTTANPATWALLSKVLPKRVDTVKHHAALSYSDVPQLVAGLRQSSGVAAPLIEFIALTAARFGEAQGATFAEIDTEARLWTVPAERMKAGNKHVVPLCDRAMEILAAMKQRSVSALIFPGVIDGGRIANQTALDALRLVSPDRNATLHGLRSSFRDWCGDVAGVDRDIAEAALAHTLKDKTEAAYRRGTALQKRRALMDAWAAFCSAQKAGNVTPLRLPR